MSKMVADLMTSNLDMLAWSLSWGNNQERKKKVASLNALKKEGLNIKVFVGGAVLTEGYAKNIGADYYSKDAKSAVEIAKLNFN